MEANVKKREWVKTAAIIFLAVMLVLTFFSNTILNYSLPEVATANVSSGTINAKLRGSGTVTANETYEVTIKQTRRVASIKVRVGDEVAAGDVLMTLEAEESEELKAAQSELESMEVSYEKSLISASTESARENREIEKLREEYNDLLAQYQQYSTMDASQVAKAKANADALLKELQAESKLAQEDYAARTAQKSDLEAEATEYKKLVSSLRTILDKKSEVTAAYETWEQDKLRYEEDYDLLLSLADGDVRQAMSYARYPDSLVAKKGDAELDLTRAKELATAFLTLSEDGDRISELETELERLIDDTDGVSSRTDFEKAYDQALYDYESVQDELEEFDEYTDYLKRVADRAEAAVSDQQAVVDQLDSAETLAAQVESAKQALEDKLFEQGLADGSALDLEVAKKAIEAQKEKVEKLTANADEVEVKAKVAGTIGEINVSAGTNASAETPLMTINQTDRGYTLKISVTNEQAKKVRVGDQAELVNYWYGGDIEATLENIAPDPQNPGKNRLLVFRLTGDVEPDTNLTLSIGQKSANYDCIVPNSAIRTDSNGTFVLAVVAKSTPLRTRYTATRVDVQELAKDDTTTAVTGLSAGDFVITTSTKPIEAGTQVRLVENG